MNVVVHSCNLYVYNYVIYIYIYNIHLTLCEPFYLSPLQTISRERICNHAHYLFFLNINIIISIDKKGIYKVHTCISNMVMEQVSLKKVQFLGKPVYEFNSIRVVLLACNPNCICILSCKLRNLCTEMSTQSPTWS